MAKIGAKGITTMQRLVAGAVAGAVAKVATAPLDLVKTILQCQAKTSAGPAPSFGGLFMDIIRKQGVLGLWRGNGVAIVRIAPYTAVKFAANNYYREVAVRTGPMTHLKSMIAGSLAGCTAVAATYPLDVCKTRFSVDDPTNPKYTGVINCLTTIAREEGVGALFKGVSTTFVGVIPYEGGQFFAYDVISDKYTKYVKRELNFYESFLIGCAAGAFAQTISYPFDSVRKRLQADRNGVYTSMGQTFVKMFREEGVSSFFRGCGINAIKMLPSSALTFSVNDQMVKMFRLYNEKHKESLVHETIVAAKAKACRK